MLERSGEIGWKRETTQEKLDPSDYLDEIYRYAYARLGSREEAEDVSMEVIQTLCRFRSEISTKEAPSLYLIGVTRRKIADYLRRRTRQRGPKTISLDESHLKSLTVVPDLDGSPLIEALNLIPELQRDVIVLKYLSGFSTEEIAKLIGKSPQAANSLLQRSRESLIKAAPDRLAKGESQGTKR
jgi:RNA polymerase sigma-70 factor (ECF subfamily)